MPKENVDITTRVVFRRPRFSRIGTNITTSALVAVLLWLWLGTDDVEARVGIGTLTLLTAPFLLVVWWRVAQRIELDEQGIVVVGRTSRRRIPWADYVRDRSGVKRQLPGYNWDDASVPADVAQLEPIYELAPPICLKPPLTPKQQVELEAFLLMRHDGKWHVSLLPAILAIRASDASGDWGRQLAAVFRARDRYNGAAVRVPPARALG